MSPVSSESPIWLMLAVTTTLSPKSPLNDMKTRDTARINAAKTPSPSRGWDRRAGSVTSTAAQPDAVQTPEHHRHQHVRRRDEHRGRADGPRGRDTDTLRTAG